MKLLTVHKIMTRQLNHMTWIELELIFYEVTVQRVRQYAKVILHLFRNCFWIIKKIKQNI